MSVCVLCWLSILPKTTCFNMCRSTRRARACVRVCVNCACKSSEHNMQCVCFSHVKDENESSIITKRNVRAREKIRSLKDITRIHISSELFQFFRFNCTWAHQPHLSPGKTTTVNIKSIWLCQCQKKQIKWRTAVAVKPLSFLSLKILRARARARESTSSSFWVVVVMATVAKEWNEGIIKTFTMIEQMYEAKCFFVIVMCSLPISIQGYTLNNALQYMWIRIMELCCYGMLPLPRLPPPLRSKFRNNFVVCLSNSKVNVFHHVKYKFTKENQTKNINYIFWRWEQRKKKTVRKVCQTSLFSIEIISNCEMELRTLIVWHDLAEIPILLNLYNEKFVHFFSDNKRTNNKVHISKV